MGLKISGIRIENFRKFLDPFELNLVGPAGGPLDYVVLAGPNGCGKTTILEAILLGLGHEDLVASSRAINSTAAAQGWGLRADSVITVRVEPWPQLPEGQVLVETTGRGPQFGPARSPGTLVMGEPTSGDSPTNQVRVEYLSSRRTTALLGPVVPTASGNLPTDNEANRLTRFKNRLMQQLHRRFPRYSGPEPRDEVWLDRLNTFWRKFRDDGTAFSLQLVDPDDLDAAGWDLYLMAGDTRLCPSDVMSSGEIELLAMVAPLITADFDGLLLFDEPELHMHPEWQGRIVPAIQALCPQAQLVVATHADDPWDDAMSWERFLLVPDTDPRSAKWRADHTYESDV